MPLVKPSLPPKPSSSVDQEPQLPTFAPCPRTTFATGHTDWYRITSPKAFSNVDICSSCYNATFRNTKYARCITEATSKPKEMATKCDLSDRWNRAAVVWIFLQNQPDLTLLGTVAELPPDQDGECPNLNIQDPEVQKGGKPAATRTWYCLYDPAAGSLVEDLTVCSACVARVNLIFPCLKGLFQPVADGQKLPATCDLLTSQVDEARCEQYLSQILETAIQTVKTGSRNVGPLVDFIKKWAPIPVCLKGGNVPPGTTSYTFPTSIPNYAACLECYTTHILPLLNSSSPPPVLKEMTPNVLPNGFICDLYSPRLQQYFTDAIASSDMETYKQRLHAREAKMQEYSLRLQQMQLQFQQLNRQARMSQLEQRMAQSMETVNAMSWSSSAYYAPPLDFSRSTAAMNKSHQAMLQAEMMEENMNMVRREWTQLYE